MHDMIRHVRAARGTLHEPARARAPRGPASDDVAELIDEVAPLAARSGHLDPSTDGPF
ncbi:hypothetical protein SAMN04515678_10793 [Roseivivax sediminis]|uniref:Uncharacterized protein n=2 Tax=Roseivivax sediminis TaxID=936889 RepID=A0A1I1YKX8_9RHOB|nr:hypothetical protein SAMN04515678_10793 [Roseivivax sediminis]